MKRDVGTVLQKLIRDKAKADYETDTQSPTRHDLTSLGVPLTEQDDGRFLIDLSDVRVFSGLSTFVRQLTNDVIEQCGFGVADIMVRRKVDPHLTPELVGLGLDWVMIYARTDAVESLPWYYDKFGRYMHLVFSAIQTARWGGALLPEFFNITEDDKSHTLPALLFPFHLLYSDKGEGGYYFLLEHSKSGRFLRISIEDAATSRLQLKHIPHRVVDNLDRQGYLPDIQNMAMQIHQGILRECQNYRAEYKEIPERQPDLFDHLRNGGLTGLTTILFRWPADDARMMLLKQKDEFSLLLNKEILLLEDSDVLALLKKGHMIEMKAGSHRAFFDVSRHGTCLNISLDERRTLLGLDCYLDQMPLLRETCETRKDVLKNVRLFLIHHITAEVLGLISSFQQVGCSSIKTFFVKYAGIIPDEYLETLLSLPEDIFSFYGLQEIESKQSVRGSYVLSQQYSSTAGLDDLDQILQKESFDFLDSMRMAAGHLFMKEALECRKDGEILLLVEDGGYLAPLINEFCLNNMSLAEVLSHFRVLDSSMPRKEMKMPFSEWLADIFIGSIEHTRNGFDYNHEIMERFGKLQFPVCSIAISDLKRGPEARECSASIVNAIENILNRLGLILSGRRVLILGSSGAIASCTMRDLYHRIGPENIIGVDIAASGNNETGCVEVRAPEEIDNEILYDIDLVIGVVGKSIIKEGLLEDMIINGRQRNLFFASGSTKTVEFTDLINWLHKLSTQERPEISGDPVRITTMPVRDLQTGILQAQKVSITFENKSKPGKNIYLLGGLTPINFLYYGIPREIIDNVMSQLLSVSAGLVDHTRRGELLPSQLLAVDHEIDMDANLTAKPDANP